MPPSLGVGRVETGGSSRPRANSVSAAVSCEARTPGTVTDCCSLESGIGAVYRKPEAPPLEISAGRGSEKGACFIGLRARGEHMQCKTRASTHLCFMLHAGVEHR